MTPDYRERTAALAAYFANLSPASVAQLPQFYAPEVVFKDPFNEVQGLAAVTSIFEHMYTALEAPHFVVTHSLVDGDQAFLTWDFKFKFKRFDTHTLQTVRGGKLTKLTMEIGMKAFQNRDEVGAAAVPYLRVVGHLVYAYLFARMAKIALEKEGSGDSFYKAKLATARFYFGRLLPETAMLIRQARSGSDNLMALDAALF